MKRRTERIIDTILICLLVPLIVTMVVIVILGLTGEHWWKLTLVILVLSWHLFRFCRSLASEESWSHQYWYGNISEEQALIEQQKRREQLDRMEKIKNLSGPDPEERNTL